MCQYHDEITADSVWRRLAGIMGNAGNRNRYYIDQGMPSLTTPHVNEHILQENKVYKRKT